MKRFSIIPLAVLAFTPLHSATAQVQQPPVERGARIRIRVTAPSVVSDRDIFVGTVASWESEHLVLDAERPFGTLTFPMDSIIKLEISRGKKSKVAVGAGIGVLVGGISGYLACGRAFPVRRCDKRVVVGAIFAVPGAALGAIVGAAASPTIWEEVPASQFRVSFGPQRDGRLGVGASVRF